MVSSGFQRDLSSARVLEALLGTMLKFATDELMVILLV